MVDPSVARQAAELIAQADGLIITAGAGMGVDSGLPDFRGDHGFWKAYPPYERLGLRFTDLANPHWFEAHPARAWGFYGHRRNLYRATTPHPGFALLRAWAQARPSGAVVFTSNVDQQFQKAGFDPDQILEVHGSIEWLQCLDGSCGTAPWPAGPEAIEIDMDTMEAAEPLPRCPTCGSLARPGILMFVDSSWDDRRTSVQQRRLVDWLERLRSGRLVVIECGAGTAVPTVRRFGERMHSAGAALIRINVREPEDPEGGLSLPCGALEALEAIASAGPLSTAPVS